MRKNNKTHLWAKIVGTLLSFALISVGHSAAATAAERPQTNVAALQELAREAKAQAEAMRAAPAFQLLVDRNRLNRIPGERSHPQLIRLSSGGHPVFYGAENLNAARTISTDDLWGAPFSLSGTGIQAGMLGQWDDGSPLSGHDEFGPGDITFGDTWDHYSYHATHVAGTMLASGDQNDPDGWSEDSHGMAIDAELVSYSWVDDVAEMAVAAANGMLISNHSYGELCGWGWRYVAEEWQVAWYGDSAVDAWQDYKFGFYTDQTRQFDEIAYEAPYYLIVKSAGNDRFESGPGAGEEYWWQNPANGYEWEPSTVERRADADPFGFDTLTPPGAAKNILTIGAVEDLPNGYSDPASVDLIRETSYGPTDDGRIKPDLVANGDVLTSCVIDDVGSTNRYGAMTGTSSAAASVSGSIALLTEHYLAERGEAPLSSTMKAVLIATADEAGDYSGPDYTHGWGLVNSRTAAEFISDGIVIEDVLTDGATNIHCINTTAFETVTVTLAWTDPQYPWPLAPAVDPSQTMLVNDLDLRVIANDPPFATNYPFVLDPAHRWDPPTRGDNARDNVEMVRFSVAPGENGIMAITVTHKEGLVIDQPYSLVVRGASSYIETVTVRPDGPITIQAAIDAIQARTGHGTVLIADGTYSGEGNCELDFRGKPITVRSESGNPEDCVIDCQGGIHEGYRGFHFQSGEENDSVLDGVKIINGHADDGGGIRCDTGTSPTIINCILADNTATHEGGGLRCYGASPDVINCWFIGNHAAQGGGGIKCESNARPDITDCTFVENTCGNTGGAIAMESSGPTIEGCTFYGNAATNGGSGLRLYNSSPKLYNSIIAFGVAGAAVSCGGNCDPIVECSDIYGTEDGNWTDCFAGLVGVANNFSDDPAFCNATFGNFTLGYDSPCAAENNPACGQVGSHAAACDLERVAVYPDGSGFWPTIQSAIDAVTPGGFVTLAPGTYTGPGNRDLDTRGKALTLHAMDFDAATCIIDAEGGAGDEHRCFDIHRGEGSDTVIRDITLTGGYAYDGGGMSCTAASAPTLIGIVFAGNTSTDDGGGLLCADNSAVDLTDCRFENNLALDTGGGAYINASATNFTTCVFKDNTCNDDGGGLIAYNGANGVVRDCVFEANRADDDGGGVYCGDNTSTHFWYCLFNMNSSGNRGGGLAAYSSSPMVENCTIYGNDAPHGSAVAAYAGSQPILERTLIAFNLNPYEGSVYCEDTSGYDITCCDVWGNMGGDWVDCIAGEDEDNDNLHEDPLFCDAPAGDFNLQEGSLCLPYGTPCSGIGAFFDTCPAPVDHDIIGLYGDPEATITQWTVASGLEFDLYLVLGNPSDLSGVAGWECALPLPDDIYLTDTEFYGDSVVNVGTPPNYRVGISPPLPNSENIVLARFTYLTVGDDRRDFLLTPSSPSSFDPPSSGYVPGGGGDLVRATPSSGAYDLPVFVLNPAAGHTYLIRANGTGDYPTIAAALGDVSSGDTILLDDGTFTGPENRNLDPHGLTLTIRSLNGKAGACVIDCDFLGRGFDFHTGEGAAFVLQGITIKNGVGDTGGAIRCRNASSPTIRECVFIENSADLGGAIGAQEQSLPDIDKCAFAGNTAILGGGLGLEFSVDSTYLAVTDCTFFANAATNGGAVYSSKGRLEITRSILWQNSASGFGDQVSHENTNETLTINCSDIDGGAAGLNTEGGLHYYTNNISLPPLFCAPEVYNLELAAGSPCLIGNHDCALLMGAYDQGCNGVSDVPAVLPAVTTLAPNRPNPFNPSTVISFTLAAPQRVRLVVYDLKGRQIATLVDEVLAPGWHEVTWRGQDAGGARVASGVYFYRMEAGNFRQTKSMALIK